MVLETLKHASETALLDIHHIYQTNQQSKFDIQENETRVESQSSHCSGITLFMKLCRMLESVLEMSLESYNYGSCISTRSATIIRTFNLKGVFDSSKSRAKWILT